MFMHPACAEPRDPGPCREYVPAYYYDPYSNSCREFIYGGCGGNRNRFYSYHACNLLCKRSQAPWILRPVGESGDDWSNFLNGEGK
ncbi:hypothetical protein ACTXT7_003488 [Hymenolepis weldensis]